ncbi:type II secretion system protein [Polaromonas sp.]|uniref:type II secretion system protein n=1 Tax=Polaromonas sp. TaxID=1869339 RepID=UPI00248921D0|nr:type II secretion system protein [Polaromonas sp.]MDI1274574.1 type II secretion system protein [Polaromonas sp.]
MSNQSKTVIQCPGKSHIARVGKRRGLSLKIRQFGFSLIEIALVLVIAGLALGAGMAALGPQLINKKFSDTQRQLQDASDAIVAFAMVNRRLPCPATATSVGRESFCTNPNPAGGCGAEVFVTTTAGGGAERGRCFVTANPNTGFVPAATLGMAGQGANGLVIDAWARPLRYIVPSTVNTTTNNGSITLAITPATCGANASTCYPFTHADGIRNRYYNPVVAPVSDVRVCDSIGAANCAGGRQLANPAFAVYSYAANLNAAPPALSVDEAANVNNDRILVSHPRNEATTPVNTYFDDVVVWLTVEQLIQRMQGNGVLP